MDKNKKRWLIVLGVVLLIGLIIIALVLGWFSRRGKAFDSRPLVLIHEPGYDDYFQVGDGVIIHATATEDNGLTRIELWVNDVLIDALDAEGADTTNLVLFSTWLPTYEGEQQIIVRAISNDDISGQSSIRINVLAADESVTTHIVGEGETLESIAEDYGISPAELEDLNPGLGEGGPAQGDGLILPDEDPAPEEPSPAPERDSEPPVFGGAPAMMESTFSFSDVIPSRDIPILLRVEIPRLETEISYEGLHCYLGLADHLPQWYPDSDSNQSTNEWFEALGGGRWETEGILDGSAMPLIIWPEDQTLPATINCVGITGGGSDSVDLGQLDIEIPPFWWTGIRRTFGVDGAGGRFEVDVRVSRYRGGSRLTPKTPDPDMEVPFNQGLDRDARTFSWDYSEEGQTGILGFEIFLNDNLLWTEEPANRESRMPAEWFRPPCGTTYTFGVRAYRYDSEDDTYYESDLAEISIRPPGDSCVRQLQITFLSLETFDLGGDGSREVRIGSVGPAYGGFYANGHRFLFGDTGTDNRILGLNHNTTYDLGVFATWSDWYSNGPNTVYVDLPEGRTLRVGFSIMDQDGNRDDQICRGVHLPLNDELVDFDEVFTSTIVSDNRQCDVRFEIRPGPDSPVGSPGEGGEPLPWLDFVRHTVNEGRGEISLLVRNTGTAGWSEQDLTIGLFTREGEFIKEVTIPDFDLPVGENVFVTHEDLWVDEPYDFCLHLDLYDEVLELPERTGNLTHALECPEIPDLEIKKVHYEERRSGTVVVEFQNVGPVEIEDRSVQIAIRDPEGALLLEPINFPMATYRGWETRRLYFSPIDPSVRERMADGYTVTINSNRSILERSYENNVFTIEPATRLSVHLSTIHVPEPATEIVEIHVDGYVLNGREVKSQVVDFNVSHRQDWSCNTYEARCNTTFRDYEYFEDWFEIYGDEDFRIDIDITHPGTDAGGGSLLDSFSTSDIHRFPTWGAGSARLRGLCSYDPSRTYGGHQYSFYDWAGREWAVRFDFCRENYDD